MKCPNCNATLLMTDKQGVEIDYCPECRGIWLDKGELEKIMDKTGNHYSDRNNYDSDYKKYNYGGDYKQQQYPHKKKKSFLDDFFDF